MSGTGYSRVLSKSQLFLFLHLLCAYLLLNAMCYCPYMLTCGRESSGSNAFIQVKLSNFIAGRPKAVLPFWFLVVVLLSICLLPASIVAT